MNKKDAMNWVKALRSGKYKQGQGALLKEGKHCCLGVLCELSGIKKTEIAEDHYNSESGDIEKRIVFKFGKRATGHLPPSVQKKFKLHSDSGDGGSEDIRISGRYYSDLVNANDEGVSFKSIATWIEKNYEKL